MPVQELPKEKNIENIYIGANINTKLSQMKYFRCDRSPRHR